MKFRILYSHGHIIKWAEEDIQEQSYYSTAKKYAFQYPKRKKKKGFLLQVSSGTLA